MNSTSGLVTQEIASAIINRGVKDIDLVKSPLVRDDLYLVVLTDTQFHYETILYIIKMN